MGKKRFTVVLLLTILSLISFNRYFLFPKPIIFSFVAEGEKTVDFEVFYEKNKNHPFSQKFAITQKINLAKVKNVSFSIPIKRIEKLRLDFGSNPGTVTVSNLKLVGRKTFKVNVSNKSKTNQLDKFSVSEDGLTITSSRHDPFVVLSDNLNVKAAKSFDSKIFIIIFTLAFMFFYKLVAYLSKFKIIENNSRIDIVFLCTIAFLMFIPLSKIDNSVVSTSENRTLATYRRLFKDGLLNQNYGKDFETWFNDRFNGRASLIKNYNKLKLLLSNRKENDKVLIGKDNWAFYKGNSSIRNFQNLDLFSEDELASILSYLSEIDEWCIKNGKKFYFIIAPDKNKIYGEYFDYSRKINPDEKSRANQLVNYLKSNSKLQVLYSYDAVYSQKDNGNLLYWKNDTHWNELGAYYAYLELMKKISPDFANLPVYHYEKLEEYTRPNGDLSKMYKEYKQPDDSIYKKPVINKTFNCQTKKIRGDTLCTNPQGKYRAFLFMDSFSENLLPYFAATFKNLHTTWRYQIKTPDLKVISDNADIVIMEVVERLLPELKNLNFPENLE